jgi:hypothetical protein
MNIPAHAKTKSGKALNRWNDKLNYLARYLVHFSRAKMAVASPPAMGCRSAQGNGAEHQANDKNKQFHLVTFWPSLAPRLGKGREKYITDPGRPAAVERRPGWSRRNS